MHSGDLVDSLSWINNNNKEDAFIDTMIILKFNLLVISWSSRKANETSVRMRFISHSRESINGQQWCYITESISMMNIFSLNILRRSKRVRTLYMSWIQLKLIGLISLINSSITMLLKLACVCEHHT